MSFFEVKFKGYPDQDQYGDIVPEAPVALRSWATEHMPTADHSILGSIMHRLSTHPEDLLLYFGIFALIVAALRGEFSQ